MIWGKIFGKNKKEQEQEQPSIIVREEFEANDNVDYKEQNQEQQDCAVVIEEDKAEVIENTGVAVSHKVDFDSYFQDHTCSKERQTIEELKAKLKKKPNKTVAQSYILHQFLVSDEYECLIGEDSITYTDLDLTVKVICDQIDKLPVCFRFECWVCNGGISIIEGFAGANEDLCQALNEIGFNFKEALLKNLFRALSDTNNLKATTSKEVELNGHTHRFFIYNNQCIQRGIFVEDPDVVKLYTLVLDNLSEYLGNQVFYKVSIFLSHLGEDWIASCSINDVECYAMQAKLEQFIKKLDPSAQGTLRLNIIVKEDPKTILPYPYRSAQDQARFKQQLKQIIKLYQDNDLDPFSEQMEQKVNTIVDNQDVFASLLVALLPEVCAELIFKIKVSEQIYIYSSDKATQSVNKTTSADYALLRNTLINILINNDLGEDTIAQIKVVAMYSSIANMIINALQKNKDVDFTDGIANVGICAGSNKIIFR